MNPEIEKLIDLVLADGQITEKEKSVIFKKAAELGIDRDEIEIILDGLLHQLERNKPKEKEKVGNIKICPACGGPIKTLEVICPGCGHEMTNTGLNKVLNTLLERIIAVDFNSYQFEDDYYNHIASIIRSSAIPNSPEEIYQFGIKAVSEIRVTTGSWEEDSSAWKSKVEDCILKLKMIETQDHKFQQLRLELEESLKRKSKEIKKNNSKDWLLISVIFGLIILLIYFLPKIMKHLEALKN